MERGSLPRSAYRAPANAAVLQNPIINHTTRGALRSEVEVRAAAGPAQLDQITALLADAARHTPAVAGDPPPYVRVTAVEPERVTVLVRFWHPWDAGRKVTSDVATALALHLHQARAHCDCDRAAARTAAYTTTGSLTRSPGRRSTSVSR